MAEYRQGPQHAQRPARRIPLWLLVTGVTIAAVMVVAGVTGFVLWTLSLDDAHGNPLIDAPGAVVIGGVLAAVTALLAPLVTVLASRLRDIRHQVQNSHASNLRDDIDDKHDEVVAVVRALRDHMDARFDRVETRIDRAERDIDALEDSEARHHPKGAS